MSFHIYGIGVDIEDVSRFKGKTIENDLSFLEKIYTSEELSYCFSSAKTSHHLAGRYCAKEACVKALRDTSLLYNEIEVLNDESGAPVLHVKKKEYENFIFHISISHTKNVAIANVVAIRS